MPKKKTHEEFVLEVKKLVGNEYDVVGKYSVSTKKIEMKHNKCSTTYQVLPSKFLVGNRCPECNHTKKKTHEDFTKEVFGIVGDEYTVMSKYQADRKNIVIRHNNCNREYSITPNHFLQGRRCGECGHKERRKSHETFVAEVYHILGEDYTVLSEYVKDNQKVRMKHETCGNVYDVVANSILSTRTGCPVCSGNQKLTTETFKEKVHDVAKDDFVVIGKYINNNTQIEMYHTVCDNSFFPLPSNFLSGSRCPHCKSSRGEEKINLILRENNVDFKRQFKIDECKNINPLPFDFAVFKEGKLDFLIEYQGQQHYKTVEIFGGREGFKKTKHNDRIKKEYCIKNNIRLIEIPYFKFKDIDRIVGGILS